MLRQKEIGQGASVGKIRVKVKLFGTLRKYAPGYDQEKGLDVTLAEGETVQNLLDTLGIPEDEARLFFIGGAIKKLTDRLHDGDEISLFLPMAGG
jgi:molybdopterin converting factor small subunit